MYVICCCWSVPVSINVVLFVCGMHLELTTENCPIHCRVVYAVRYVYIMHAACIY